MTVIRAPRITPRIVSSLTPSPPRNAPRCSARLAILFSQIDAGAGRRRGRVAADRLPAAVFFHPDVRQHDAILDDATKIFEAPARLDGSDHHVLGGRRVEDFDFDGVDLAPLDGVEPFLAVHHERARGTRSD